MRYIRGLTGVLLSFVSSFLIIFSALPAYAAGLPSDAALKDSSSQSYVTVDESSSPDANFRKYVAEKLDDGDGILRLDELERVTSIDCRGLGISSLSGINSFTSLRTLDCGSNSLTSLDLTGLGSLTVLKCDRNDISRLDLSPCTSLRLADYSYNRVSSFTRGSSRNLTIINDCNIRSASNKDSGITITWDPMLGGLYDKSGKYCPVDGYLIYRRTEGGIYQCIFREKGVNTVSVTDTAASPGARLRYTVRPFSYSSGEVWGDYCEEGIDITRSGFVKTSGGYWYDNGDGTYPVNTWKYIDGEWYYFGRVGYVATGWFKDGNYWYFFDDRGRMKHDTWEGDYYLCHDGKMAVSKWIYDHNSRFFVGTDGRYVTGWKKMNSFWYYFYDDGRMARNCWVGNYFLKADGRMAVNQWVGGYYVGSDGQWIPNYGK